MCDQKLSLPGHVKVRLSYRSRLAHTEAALTLQKFGASGPFSEEIRILIPSQDAFSDLKAYVPAFEFLRVRNIVPKDSTLTGYAFDETEVLAYVIPSA